MRAALLAEIVPMARFVVFLCLLATAFGSLPASGNEETRVLLAQLDTDGRARTATLRLHSRPIFVFRADFASYTPEERAAGAA